MTPDPLALLVALFAAYRLTRLIVRDAFPPVKAARDWVLHRWPSADAEFFEDDVVVDDPDAPEDGRLAGTGVALFLADEGRWLARRPHWLGELVSCAWCAGAYVSAGVAALVPGVTWPWGWLLVSLALSAGVGLISARWER